MNVFPAKAGGLQRSLTGAGALIALLAVVLALSGCGPSINATISVYHTLPDRTSLTRYAFVPMEEQDESGHNVEYKNAIRRELSRYRYRETDVPAASLLLSFSYGISEGREVESRGTFFSSSYTEYRRGLWIFMFQKGAAGAEDKRIVYEGSVTCAGTLEQISMIMPQMIKALFREFPGESGKTRKTFLEPQ